MEDNLSYFTKKAGFTLVELLVVVAILGILSTAFAPLMVQVGKMTRNLNAAVDRALAVNIETGGLSAQRPFVCAVDDNCVGEMLLCLKTSKIKACTEEVPCEFLNGNWEHANQPCDEGVLAVGI